jgi:hypothetical protein
MVSTAVSLEWANQALIEKQQAAVTVNEITISPSTRFRAAMITLRPLMGGAGSPNHLQ